MQIITATVLMISTMCFTFQNHSSEIRVTGQVRDYITGKYLSDVDVILYQDGKELKKIKTTSNGKYQEMILPLDHKYKIIFSKKEYLIRSVEYDLRNIREENRYEKGWEVPLDMSLIEKELLSACKSELEKMEEETDLVIAYNLTSGELDWNMKAYEKIKHQVDDCLKAHQKE